MKGRARVCTAVFSAFMLLALIFDAKTAFSGAQEGIRLCLQTVIPSLFAFFVLSVMFTGALAGVSPRFLRPLGKLCGIPQGSEALLITGFLGGYPVGAQAVCQAYQAGCLEREDARRMLGFCSNAGPSFLFGMVAPLFPSARCAWILWGIQIVSALFVAMCLPNKSRRRTALPREQPVGITRSLERAVKTMALVCGWVVLFRTVIAFARRWVLWLLPARSQVVLIGLLELSNGCCELQSLPQLGIRFIASACFLSFGGLCVTMQTASVTAPLGLGSYLPGKLMQCAVSVLLASISQYLLFPTDACVSVPAWLPVCAVALLIACPQILKKTGGNPQTAGV